MCMSVLHPCMKAGSDMGMCLSQLGDEASLQDFKQLFSGADFHQGLELSFSSTPEGALSTRIGDKEVALQHSASVTVMRLAVGRHLFGPACALCQKPQSVLVHWDWVISCWHS